MYRTDLKTLSSEGKCSPLYDLATTNVSLTIGIEAYIHLLIDEDISTPMQNSRSNYGTT